MNKTILNPKTAERLQNEIYREMPAGRKIKIAGEMFLFGKKLDELKKQKNNDDRKITLPSSKNFSRT